MTNLKIAAKRKPARQKRMLWFVLAALVLVGGGAAAWFLFGAPGLLTGKATSLETPEYYTATARRGDLSLLASGAGVLVAGETVELSFSTSGTVAVLNTSLGAQVRAGDVLAELADPQKLEASVAQAELDLLTAQQALAALYTGADVALAQAYQAYLTAQESYADALFNDQRTAYARCSQETNTQNKLKLERAEQKLAELADSEYYGSDAWIDAQHDYDTAYANYHYCIAYTPEEKAKASAALALADAALKQAEGEYNTLKEASGVDPAKATLAEVKVENATAQLALARKNLEGAVIVAPIDGTVVSLAAGVGEKVGTEPFITLADMSRLNVEVSLDETDLAFMKVGNRAEVVFDALPEKVFAGTVVRADPALSSEFGMSAAHGIVALDAGQLGELQSLPLGLTASVDLIADEAIDAVLVPVDALHDLGDGQYAVFVVGEDSQLRLRLVETGIIDVTYAEIVSGLEAGEVVSTGLLEVSN